MTQSSYIEWCNENEGRSYPLAEYATHKSDAGDLLPSDIIADLGIILPRGYTELRFSSVYASAQIISVAISASTGGLLTGAYARASLVPYRAYPLTPLVDDVSGWIVFGNYKAGSVERYQFASAAQSAIELRATRTIPPPGVTRFYRSGGDPMVYADGLVTFDSDNNFDIFRDPADAQNIIVRLRPEAQSQYVENCSKNAAVDLCGVPVLRRIAGVPASASGVITLRFD